MDRVLSSWQARPHFTTLPAAVHLSNQISRGLSYYRTIKGDSPQKQDILSTYSGELHHLAVLDFLRDEHEVVHELVELENVDAAINFVQSSYAATLLFAATHAHEERSAAKMAAAFHDDIPFATSASAEVAAEYGVTPPALVVFRAKPQGRFLFFASPPIVRRRSSALSLSLLYSCFALLYSALLRFVLLGWGMVWLGMVWPRMVWVWGPSLTSASFPFNI